MSALFSKKNREVLLTPLGLNNPVTVQVLGQPPCPGLQSSPIKIALQERCFPQGKIHSAKQCQSCMQAVPSFHARLFPRRSIGSDGLRILSVHGTAGECRSISRRPCGCSRCIRHNTRYTIAPRHGRRQKQ